MEAEGKEKNDDAMILTEQNKVYNRCLDFTLKTNDSNVSIHT